MRGMLVLLLWVLPALGQGAAGNLYNEANALYRKGAFEEARQTYQRAVDSGASNADLFYNLGNACFKAGRLGEAILWYERALRLAPRDADIEANLRFANAVKKDREPGEGERVVWRFFVDVFFFPTLNELGLLFSASLLLVFALAVRKLMSHAPTGALWLALVLGGGGLGLLSATWLAGRVHYREHVVEAVVVAEQGTARSGPDSRQTAVFVVHEGTKVRVVRGEGEWLLVRLANGLGGWLPAKAVEAI